MNKINEYISSQFKNPRGIAGKIISLIQNIVNKQMYKNTVMIVNVNSDDKLLDIGYGMDTC